MSVSWDANRNAVIPEEVVVDNSSKQQVTGDTDTDGLFPKTGGYYGKDLVMHLLHKSILPP